MEQTTFRYFKLDQPDKNLNKTYRWSAECGLEVQKGTKWIASSWTLDDLQSVLGDWLKEVPL